jgi:hypothetical protein
LLQCMSRVMALNGDVLRRSRWSGIETAADKKCSHRVRLSMTPQRTCEARLSMRSLIGRLGCWRRFIAVSDQPAV